MKMRDQYKYKKRTKKKIIIIILIIIFFLLSKNFLIPYIINNFSFLNNISSYFLSKKVLESENKELKVSENIIKNSSNLISFYKRENENLRKELYIQTLYKQPKKQEFNIFFNSDSNIYNSISIIDKESILKKGDLVFSNSNFVFGDISKSENKIAHIDLFSRKNRENKFWISESGVIKGSFDVIGEGSGVFKIVVPRDMNFNVKNETFLLFREKEYLLVAKFVNEIFKTTRS